MTKSEGKKDVLSLALAQAAKGKDEKAVDRIKKEVRTNENDWRNAAFGAENAVDAAKERLQALQVSTSTSAGDMLDAVRAVKLAEKNVEDIKALAEERFA